MSRTFPSADPTTCMERLERYRVRRDGWKVDWEESLHQFRTIVRVAYWRRHEPRRGGLQ